MKKLMFAVLGLCIVSSPCAFAYDPVVTCSVCGEPCFMGRCPNRDDHYRDWQERQAQAQDEQDDANDDE